jgi:hypothetical protein
LGCGDGSGSPIHFIIPNGFNGKVEIIHDAENGMTLTNRAGTLVCAIPPTGQLRVKSLQPFQSWHSETASYENESKLLPASNSNGISFFALGTYAISSTSGSNAQGVIYFVGTKADADILKF